MRTLEGYVKLKWLMELSWSPFYEDNGSSDNQEIPCLSCNSKFHHRVQNSWSLGPVLSHMNSVHIVISHFFHTHFNSALLPMDGLSQIWWPDKYFGFQQKPDLIAPCCGSRSRPQSRTRFVLLLQLSSLERCDHRRGMDWRIGYIYHLYTPLGTTLYSPLSHTD
jgi:hypothetical protein